MRLVSQQCTQVPQNGAERSFSLICVHSCVLTSVHNGATVYTNDPKLCREAILANLCTLLRSHGRSRDRAGPRVPRHRRPHEPRDARALGPEVHAAGAVTQPPTYTNSRSLLVGAANCRATPSCGKAIWQLIQPDLIVLSRHERSRRINEVEKTSRELGLTGARGSSRRCCLVVRDNVVRANRFCARHVQAR